MPTRNTQRPSNTATGGHAPVSIRTPGTPATIDKQDLERAMEGLRRFSLLLSVALAAVIARLVIDGPTVAGGLTGALILALLLFSLRLKQQGRRLQPSASPETERTNAS
jgi:hypothetical protein